MEAVFTYSSFQCQNVCLFHTFFTNLWPLLVVNNHPGTSKTESIVAMTRPWRDWNAIGLPNDCLIQGIMNVYKLQVGMPDVSKFTCFFLSVSKRIQATYIPTRYHESQWRQTALNMAYMDDMYIKQVDLIISVTYWSPWGLCTPSSNLRRSIKMFT